MKIFLFVVLSLVLVGVGMGGWRVLMERKQMRVTDFIECGVAGYPVTESYPRRCTLPNGKTFTEEVKIKDLVHVTLPNEDITSPLTITGDAVGNWYFEGSFPIVLLDNDGKELASTIATAQGEWMTEDYVPFTAVLTFSAPPGGKGTLVLKKDNPSGLPEHDNELSIAVRFGRNSQ